MCEMQDGGGPLFYYYRCYYLPDCSKHLRTALIDNKNDDVKYERVATPIILSNLNLLDITLARLYIRARKVQGIHSNINIIDKK